MTSERTAEASSNPHRPDVIRTALSLALGHIEHSNAFEQRSSPNTTSLSPGSSFALECSEVALSSPESDEWKGPDDCQKERQRYLYPCNQSQLDFEVPQEGCSDLPHPEVEYIRPNCYLLTYFTGHPQKMVNSHFARSLASVTESNTPTLFQRLMPVRKMTEVHLAQAEFSRQIPPRPCDVSGDAQEDGSILFISDFDLMTNYTEDEMSLPTSESQTDSQHSGNSSERYWSSRENSLQRLDGMYHQPECNIQTNDHGEALPNSVLDELMCFYSISNSPPPKCQKTENKLTAYQFLDASQAQDNRHDAHLEPTAGQSGVSATCEKNNENQMVTYDDILLELQVVNNDTDKNPPQDNKPVIESDSTFDSCDLSTFVL